MEVLYFICYLLKLHYIRFHLFFKSVPVTPSNTYTILFRYNYDTFHVNYVCYFPIFTIQ